MWFLNVFDTLETVTGKVPQVMVLEEQVAMINATKARIAQGLEREKEIQATTGKPYLDPEIRENMALLARMYHDHFRTLQESGLEPKATQKVKVEETRRGLHEVFHFLSPEQALHLKRLQAEVDAGTIDLMKFYQRGAPRSPSQSRSQRRPVGRLLFGLEDRCRRLLLDTESEPS